MRSSTHLIQRIKDLSRDDLELLALTVSAVWWTDTLTGLPDPERALTKLDFLTITKHLTDLGLTLPDPEEN